MLASILEQIYPLHRPAVILANGQFPQDPYLQQLLQNTSTLICCDGAANHLMQTDIIPHFIIGDCDSLLPEARDRFKDKIINIAEQNSNDLSKAVNLAATLKLSDVVILGATGLREDHTLANISLLEQYSRMIERVAIISDYGIFTAHQGGKVVQIATVPGQQVSLFPPTLAASVTCLELKWPLHNHLLNSWFTGTLNQATGNMLNLMSDAKIIVYRRFGTILDPGSSPG